MEESRGQEGGGPLRPGGARGTRRGDTRGPEEVVAFPHRPAAGPEESMDEASTRERGDGPRVFGVLRTISSMEGFFEKGIGAECAVSLASLRERGLTAGTAQPHPTTPPRFPPRLPHLSRNRGP